ncbi:MAG TPA: peptidase S15, partial [Acidimicrobiia bacterium]
ISAADHAWFVSHGPGPAIDKVDVPTLFVQGTVDTLFTLDEAITNYHSLRSRGVPTAMLWYCGGHGVCLTPQGDAGAPDRETLAWLDHYLQHKTVALGPRFSMVDQRGVTYTAPDYPVPTRSSLTGTTNGTLNLVATGGSGPAKPPKGSTDPLAGAAGAITPAFATNAVNVRIVSPSATEVVAGAPMLTLRYSGTVPAGLRPTAVFAQLVDNTSGLVIGNQVTPVALTLDGRTQTVTVPLESIAFTFERGRNVTAQIVATTVAYGTPRLGGKITMQATVSLPVSTLTPR